MTASQRFGRGAAGLFAALAACALVDCTYDFDEPFSKVDAGLGGGASTTTTGAGAGGTTSSGGGGAGGQGPAEDCTNGTDDDGDELVDCEDPDCSDAGWTCVDAPPADWTGPALLVVDPDPCPAAYATTLDGGSIVDAPPASCAACGCDPPSGGACALPTIAVYDGVQCQAQENALSPGMPGSCDTFSTTDPNSGFKSSNPAVDSAGTCAATGGGVTSLPPPAWSDPRRVCTAPSPGGGCSGAAVCAATAPTIGSCIHRSGDVPCPSSSSYTYRTVVYAGWDDERTCDPCTCDSPTGGSCVGAITVDMFTGIGCVVPLPSFAADGACHGLNAPGTTLSYSIKSNAPSGGSCATNGGQPSGSVTGVGPITVCCAP